MLHEYAIVGRGMATSRIVFLALLLFPGGVETVSQSESQGEVFEMSGSLDCGEIRVISKHFWFVVKVKHHDLKKQLFI